MGCSILPGLARGPLLVSPEGLSFWGGVDPASGRIIDAHHPLCGRSVAGVMLAMPTSRGSCTGSAALLELIRNGHAPAALIFQEPEDVLTLGALVATHLFEITLPVIRLEADEYAALKPDAPAETDGERLRVAGSSVPLRKRAAGALELTGTERSMLDGHEGKATQVAMRILCAVAAIQGAGRLIEVSQVHIDGCLYGGPATLRFAEVFAEMGARVRVPTTLNAISVDHEGWRLQGVPPDFGVPAQRLADAYVEMGARASFTCAPYLLDAAPRPGEAIGWAESNAVVYANSVIGARTAKHPDFLDLCIALTGRAPLAGAYLDANRAARRIVAVEAPAEADDAFWPLLGYLAGECAPDRIPLLTGIAHLAPRPDDLKALCAAFGTTSAAPMLHIAGVTPESDRIAPDADRARITLVELARVWRAFNSGPAGIDLVAMGSPHLSLDECRNLARLMAGRRCAEAVTAIVTLGRDTFAAARAEGVAARLKEAGIRLQPDLCWCTISEPVFPPGARTVMTNSGKYAHYGPGLSGRSLRFGSLADCASAACTGRAPDGPPGWLDKATASSG
jgi:predicted aconitase/predicted aconitase with swiveling domain